MNEKKEALEKAGYQFIIDETDSKDPEGVTDAYYRIVVKSNGKVVGSRSELTQEDAMERAIELAEVHQKNPTKAEEKTLSPSASVR